MPKLVPALLLDWVDSLSTTVRMSPTRKARLSLINELPKPRYKPPATVADCS
ncbi:hypothetical protein D3C77_665900 [compost metagenome]